MKEFGTAMSTVKRAQKMLEKLPEEQHYHVLGRIYSTIGGLLLLTGQVQEALPYLEDCIDGLKQSLGSTSYELSAAYNYLGGAYLQLDRPDSAVQVFEYAKDISNILRGPHHLRSLEILRNLSKAYAVAGRYSLAIDTLEKAMEGFKEHGQRAQHHMDIAIQFLEWLKVKARDIEVEKTFEHDPTLQSEMKVLDMCSHTHQNETDKKSLTTLIASERYDEAIKTMKAVIPKTGEESIDRAMILSLMGQSFCRLKKFDEAKKCLENSLRILDKHESIRPNVVVESLIETSTSYQEMHEYESAMLILRRALKLLEKLTEEGKLLGKVNYLIGALFALMGQMREALPYLEGSLDSVKEQFGSTSYEVGSAYNYLGAVYMALDRPDAAIEFFSYAKDIMHVKLGPDHLLTLGILRNLSTAYAAVGRYSPAIDALEKVVEGLRHGKIAPEKLDLLIRLLGQYKEKARREFSESSIKDFLFPECDDNSCKNSGNKK